MTEKLPPAVDGSRDRVRRATTSKQPPAHALSSVDNALRLAAMLQQEGRTTVTEAARRLGVSPATAHRLLTTLVYRDFASHEPHGDYLAGPVLQGGRLPTTSLARLRAVAHPHLIQCAGDTGETCNLVIRVRDHVRFIGSAEGWHADRVAPRDGMGFPLHRTSAGLVLLAAMSEKQVSRLYSPEHYAGRESERPVMRRLGRELSAVRRLGKALNVERSEVGVVALGRPVLDEHGETVAAMTLSLPMARFDPASTRGLDRRLALATEAVHQDLVSDALATG